MLNVEIEKKINSRDRNNSTKNKLKKIAQLNSQMT
jgi:hypothetical protein